MRRLLIVAALMLLGAAVVASYQICSVYLANMELATDLKELSSLTGTRIGLVRPAICLTDPRPGDRACSPYGIHLEPEQINVERNGEGKDGSICISTAYDTAMNVFGFRLDHPFHRRQPPS